MATLTRVRHSLVDSSMPDYTMATMQGSQYLYQDTSISICVNKRNLWCSCMLLLLNYGSGVAPRESKATIRPSLWNASSGHQCSRDKI